MRLVRGIVTGLLISVVLYGPPVISHLCLRRVINDGRNETCAQGQALATLAARGVVDYGQLQSISVKVKVPGGSGSGVLFSRDGCTFCWTAGHVVDTLRNEDGSWAPATIVREVRVDGLYQESVEIEAKVIAYSEADECQDIAILELVTPLSDSTIFAKDQVYPTGTSVVHVGSMRGLYNSVTLGIISQTDRDILENGIMFDQTCAISHPGSSGGGVYLLDGQCIGLLVRGGNPGLGFIVPVRRMWAWAHKYNMEWALDPSVPMPKEIKVVVDEPEAVEEPEPLPPVGPE